MKREEEAKGKMFIYSICTLEVITLCFEGSGRYLNFTRMMNLDSK
jgi:hypothetical protein